MKFEPALEQELTCHEMAVERVKASIRHCVTMDMADDDMQALSSIVADVIHYCKEYDIDFQSVIDDAEMFVSEDESVDAELAK